MFLVISIISFMNAVFEKIDKIVALLLWRWFLADWF
jgi:hypothetical protein